MKKIVEYNIKLTYEADIIVKVTTEGCNGITVDSIYEAARQKALLCNMNEFKITDEVSQNILNRKDDYVDDNYRTDDNLIEHNQQNNVVEDNDEEDEFFDEPARIDDEYI